MNCCPECFNSKYLKSIIGSSSNIGTCDFCGQENAALQESSSLARFFGNLIDQYQLDEAGNPIEVEIENDFPKLIFADKNTKRKELMLSILTEDTYQQKLNGNVSLKHIKDHRDASKSWENFKNEIKNTNRFHIKNGLDLVGLKTIFQRDVSLEKIIKVGDSFFRSRLSEKNGLAIAEMRNPPPERASAGRANPKGISYLYLSDSRETTLYEIRSTLFDYITVGKFLARQETKVLNLRNFIYDPMFWTENEEIKHFLIYSPFIDKFQEDLSKPIRRGDSDIDYLPTQYLSEFIKSVGFDGIEFQSSLYREGFNLAIFKPENFECVEVEVYEIKELTLTQQKIENTPLG